jgi:hypothetical protein
MQGIGIDEKLRCAYCGEVIGAYEPLVALLDGRARSTSKMAEAADGGPLGECYHRACYTTTHGELTE